MARGHAVEVGTRCCYTLQDIQRRDKLGLDLFWIKDQSLTDTDALPPPDVIAAEIAEELEAAFELFSKIAQKCRSQSAAGRHSCRRAPPSGEASACTLPP